MPPKPIAPASSGQQHLRVLEARAARCGRWPPRLAATCGTSQSTSSSGERGQHRHQPVRRAPAGVWPEPGRGGHAGDVGDREPEHHPADRPAAPVRRRPGRPPPARRRRSRRRAAGRRGTAPASASRSRSPARWRRCRAGTRPSAPISSPRRGSRAPKTAISGAPTTTPDGVRRDDVAGRRDGDADAVGELRQQAHRDELGGADREAAHRQRDQRQAGAARRPACSRGAAGAGSRRAVTARARGSRRVPGRRYVGASPLPQRAHAARIPGRRESVGGVRLGRRRHAQASEASASLKVADGRITAAAFSASGR